MHRSILGRVAVKLKLFALFFTVSLIHLYPIFKNFFTKLPYATIGDVSLTLAILQANVQKLGLLQFHQIYHLPFLFPLSNTLTIGFTMFGQSLLLLPFYLFGQPNIYALYNGIIVFSYVAAGFGAFLFFKELQENVLVSAISACLYILLPFRVFNIPHLNLIMNFPIPFSLWLLVKYFKSGRKKDLFLLNIFLLVQYLFDLSLGFFLSVSLAFLVVILFVIDRSLQLRSFFLLGLSLLPTMAVVLLIHIPFLQPSNSLSAAGSSFNPDQYLPALSFYAGKSTLLFKINGLWDTWPFFPGFSIVFFYIFAFFPYTANKRDKILLAVMVGAFAVPGLAAVVLFQEVNFAGINAVAEIGLVVFWGALAALVFALRKQISLSLKMISLLLLAVIFITFSPFSKIIDLFSILANVFPFLSRSRGVRTAYILPLAIIGIFAFGFRFFIEKKRNKKIFLWAIVLVLLLEHFRWPVAMARLPEPSFEAKKMYKMAAPYPHHFGILELPFVPTSSNMYPFFTRYHNKHTYHGHYLTYDDPLNLKNREQLSVEKGFSGLINTELLDTLKANGLYLIMISGSFVSSVYDGELPPIWRKIRRNIKIGLENGLFKEVKEASHSFLIILDDSKTGRDISYPIPYFALVQKVSIRFKILVKNTTRSQIYFNGNLIAVRDYPPGDHETLLNFQSAPKQRQINRIRILNDQTVIVRDWLIK